VLHETNQIEAPLDYQGHSNINECAFGCLSQPVTVIKKTPLILSVDFESSPFDEPGSRVIIKADNRRYVLYIAQHLVNLSNSDIVTGT
jgi:hypothetical protein